MSQVHHTEAPNLLLLYPVPDESVSEEEADRFHHRDLPGESADSLRREIAFLRVLNFAHDSVWHRERELMVAAELSKRRERQRDAYRVPRTAS